MTASKAALAAIPLMLWSGLGCANESFGSEISHVAAGVAISSAATTIADHYGIENRGWVGFGTAIAISFAFEGVQIVANGSSQVGPSALDFAANMIGAAFGAWITDQYLLSPVMTRGAGGHPIVGLVLRTSF